MYIHKIIYIYIFQDASYVKVTSKALDKKGRYTVLIHVGILFYHLLKYLIVSKDMNIYKHSINNPVQTMVSDVKIKDISHFVINSLLTLNHDKKITKLNYIILSHLLVYTLQGRVISI